MVQVIRDSAVNRLTISGGDGAVESVTGLNTDNTDPANPIVKISVDGVTITGAGTPASPLVSTGGGIGGTISANQVAFGAGTDTIAGDADFTYDGTTLELATGKLIKGQYSNGNGTAYINPNGSAVFATGAVVIDNAGNVSGGPYNGNTIGSGSTSGTNTGDQTNITGNAGTVTSLAGHAVSELSNDVPYLITVAVDGTTITGNGTVGSPLVAAGSANYWTKTGNDIANNNTGIVNINQGLTLPASTSTVPSTFFNPTTTANIAALAAAGANGAMVVDDQGLTGNQDWFGIDTSIARRFVRTASSAALTSGAVPMAVFGGRLSNSLNTISSTSFIFGYKAFFQASTTARASLNIATGAVPTSPTDGDFWINSNHLFTRLNGVTYQIDQQGTVTSVAMTGDNVIYNTSVTGSPITSSGTLVPSLKTQTANTVLAGPATGSAATPTFRAIVAADVPTLNQNTTGSAAKWTTPRNLAGNSVDGSADVPFANKFLVQGTADAGLTGAQFMGALSTGIVKNTTTTGVQSIAAAGTDYEVPLTFSTGLTRSTNTITVNTSQNIATLSNLTGNGFVKTSGGTGALSIDTNTYLTTAGTAAAASTVTIADDTTTNATMYPVWASANTGNLPLKVSSTLMSFNPSLRQWFFNGQMGVGTNNPQAVVHGNGTSNQARFGNASDFINFDVQTGGVVVINASGALAKFSFQKPILSLLDGYLNFNTAIGTSGYGFRDNSTATGTMQYKNSGGSWNDFVSDTAYGSGWDGVTLTAPSKNVVYDEMQQRVRDGALALASDFTTSSVTAVSTNLTFVIAANEVWNVVVTGTAKKATSPTGLKVAIGAPTGCTVKGEQYSGGATLAAPQVPSLITAINTLGATFAAATNIEVTFRLEFTVTNGATPGNISLQGATVTSNVATIFAGMRMTYSKATAV